MPVAIREHMARVALARLQEVITDIPVERSRRASPADDEMPLLILRAGDVYAGGDSPGFNQDFYTVEVIVEGYVIAAADAPDPDIALDAGLSDLHARVVAALVEWAPDQALDLNEIAETGTASFTAYDLEESSTAAGMFVATFYAQTLRPVGHPYAAA